MRLPIEPAPARGAEELSLPEAVSPPTSGAPPLVDRLIRMTLERYKGTVVQVAVLNMLDDLGELPDMEPYR